MSGIDLSDELEQGALDQIYDALMEHQVIFFRDQDISPQNHFSLAQSFGDIQPPNPLYPRHEANENIMVLRSGADHPPDTGGWHTDVTYRQNPPFACLLVARTVPECGGDTLWLSLSRAWDTLPAGVQSELEDLSAVHDFGDFRNNFALGEKDADKLIEAFSLEHFGHK